MDLCGKMKEKGPEVAGCQRWLSWFVEGRKVLPHSRRRASRSQARLDQVRKQNLSPECAICSARKDGTGGKAALHSCRHRALASSV